MKQQESFKESYCHCENFAQVAYKYMDSAIQ